MQIFNKYNTAERLVNALKVADVEYNYK